MFNKLLLHYEIVVYYSRRKSVINKVGSLAKSNFGGELNS